MRFPCSSRSGLKAAFRGVVDLLELKAIVWGDDLGKDPIVIEIPDDLKSKPQRLALTWWKELPSWMMN